MIDIDSKFFSEIPLCHFPPFHGDLCRTMQHTRASVLGSRAFKYAMQRHSLGHADGESAFCAACIHLQPPSSCQSSGQSKLWGEVGAETNPGAPIHSESGSEVWSQSPCAQRNRGIQGRLSPPKGKLRRVLASAFEVNSPIRFVGLSIQLGKSFIHSCHVHGPMRRGGVVAKELAESTSYADHGMSVRSGSEHARGRM
ncbi:hypothetical protein B0H13DRAFT_1907473 [Mycena leptocephala]|nr:hypothetical protein B0H13DRAFT_1907473 [Mycena leptocephala]